MLSVPRCGCLLLLMSLATAAPVEKAGGVPTIVDDVQEQEAELQSLLQLADDKSASKDVTVHEEHVQHMHEVNGHMMEVDTSRKTVSDTNTGEVLSDVKQEVSKTDESAGAEEPEVQVKTEVDVPAEDVHETIVQSGTEAEVPQQPSAEEQQEEEEEMEEEMEFSPEAVAEFLYRTGDFNRFYSALAQLVNASIMTEEEAQSYSQLVAMEFDRLQMEDYENSFMGQRPPMMEQYPVVMDTPDAYPMPVDAPQDLPMTLEDSPEALFALEQDPRDLDLEFDPYDLVSALWKEAYGNGDARAQALVGELFDRVHGDNDPDDEGQVRDILLDLIASSVMNDEPQPQYGWQPTMDDSAALPPVPQPLPLQAIPSSEDVEAANELMAQEKRADQQPIPSKETNAVNEEQPMGSQETGQTAEAQPVAKSDTKEEDSQQTRAEQPASVPVAAQKRAAETV